MDTFVASYLQRIGLDPMASRPATVETLATLQEAHVSTVPFEILDCMAQVPISTDTEHLFGKIVTNRRGGFCYELNGLFFQLLTSLGFEAQRLAAWHPKWQDDYDHFMIKVKAEGQWFIADVGFRVGALLPLAFALDVVQEDPKGLYRFVQEGPYYWLERKTADDLDFAKQYRFLDQPHQMADYAQRCHWYATYEGSPFRMRPSCSLETRHGEIYLNEKTFVNVVGGQLVQRDVAGPDDFYALCRTVFGINPPADSYAGPAVR